MGNFDSRRPGPEALTTEATTAESIVGTPRDHTSLRELVKNYGIPAALAVSALAGINGVARADAQEDTSGQNGYPGPSEENQGYPAPVGDTIDQEPTVDPAASATPSPTGEATLEAAQYEQWPAIYLPYGASDRPKGTPGATATAVEASPTATDIVPSPTHTNIPPTATTAPTNTAIPPTPTELPIATETPARKEIVLSPEAVIASYADVITPWGYVEDLLAPSEEVTILGTIGSNILVQTSQGTFLTDTPSGFSTEGLVELKAPQRSYSYASSEKPIEINLRESYAEPLPLLDTVAQISQGQGYEYQLRGSLSKGGNLTLNMPSGTIILRRDGASMKVEYNDGQATLEERLEELAGDTMGLSIKAVTEEGRAKIQILNLSEEVGTPQAVLASFDVRSLPAGDLHFSTTRGNIFLNALTFSADPILGAVPRQFYRDRINHGIFSQTGLRVGNSIFDSLNGQPDFNTSHGGLQTAQFEFGPSAFTGSMDWPKEFFKHHARAANAQGVVTLRTIPLFGPSGQLNTADGVRAHLADIESLQMSGPIAVGLIGYDGKISIPSTVLEAFELDRPSSGSAAEIIAKLSNQMGELQTQTSGETQIFLDVPGGFNMADSTTLLNSIDRIIEAGAPIEGVYLRPGINPSSRLRSVLEEFKVRNLRIGLTHVSAKDKVSLEQYAEMVRAGLIDEIILATGGPEDPELLMRRNDSLTLDYSSANAQGPVPGSLLDRFMKGFARGVE